MGFNLAYKMVKEDMDLLGIIIVYSDTYMGPMRLIHTYHAAPMPFPCHVVPIMV
jgi:hypothetical protein